MGRPSKFTPENREAILKGVQAGLSRPRAAALAGVSGRTLTAWLTQARQEEERGEEEGEYLPFLLDIKRAESTFIATNIKGIRAAGETTWTARAWLLERNFPLEFGAGRAELKRAQLECKAVLAETRKLMEQLGALAARQKPVESLTDEELVATAAPAKPAAREVQDGDAGREAGAGPAEGSGPAAEPAPRGADGQPEGALGGSGV